MGSTNTGSTACARGGRLHQPGRDHLDYHPSIEAYLAAKLRLFEDCCRTAAAAVIDADHDMPTRSIAAARRRGLAILTVGRAASDPADRRAIDGFAQTLRARARRPDL